jgi:hypothetical protein
MRESQGYERASGFGWREGMFYMPGLAGNVVVQTSSLRTQEDSAVCTKHDI